MALTDHLQIGMSSDLNSFLQVDDDLLQSILNTQLLDDITKEKGQIDEPTFNQSAYLGQDIWEEKLSLPEELLIDHTNKESTECSAPTIAAILQEPLDNDFEKSQPKPVRKRPKQYVPDDEKNERYWEKRYKNNLAARKSREAKRLRENRQNFEHIEKLEREKKDLQEKLNDALRENQTLKQKIGLQFSTVV